MKKIDTKFGTIYIEEWAYDRRCPAMREEKDRVKLFDSNEEYLEYLPAEYVSDEAEEYDVTPQAVLDRYAYTLASAQSIEDLLDMLDIDYEFVTTSVDALVTYFGEAYASEEEPPTKEEVLSNEWVNRIGDYYIVVCEY